MSVTVQPTAPPSSASEAAIPDVPIYRLTVEQYRAMARAGILDEGAPVELLEGWLVCKMTQNPPHVLVSGLLHDALHGLIPAGWHVRVHNPVATVDSEPEPDLAVIRGSRRDYQDRHPSPPDTALVVEVADTSLRQDRGTKMRLYARAGIPVYWIVNLIDQRIEVYTDPSGPAAEADYRGRHDYEPTDTIPVRLDGVEVGSLAVTELLP